jgi:hypothetical protein
LHAQTDRRYTPILEDLRHAYDRDDLNLLAKPRGQARPPDKSGIHRAIIGCSGSQVSLAKYDLLSFIKRF